MTHSESVENYLKTIWSLEEASGRAATNAIARRLDVAPASVTGMVRRLATRGLVVHVPYRGATLTTAGRAHALAVVRRHRLIETFLVEIMGVAPELVHAEAERWEHVVSDEMTVRMDELLGRPARDPHGAPIPPAPAPAGAPRTGGAS